MRFDQRAFLSGILFLLFFGTAEAQFNQYTPPGGPSDRLESRKEELDREMEEAHHHMGPVRIVPLLEVKDVAYQQSISGPDETPADFTATAGAGFRAYLHTGPKVIWRLHALPEYVWWQKQSERRRLNGRYELGAFGFFNRLTLEAVGGRTEEQRIAHPEVLRLLNTGQTYVRLSAEIGLSGALSVFATASATRDEQLGTDAADPAEEALAQLDRDERVTRAGVRWRRRSGLTLGLGVERSEADFHQEELDRSNAGTSPVAEFLLDRRHLKIQADVAARSLEAHQGSAFVPYDKGTGRASVTFLPKTGLELAVYGSRDLVYSLLPEYAYLDDNRLGTSVQVGLGQSLTTRLFGETGRERYTAFSAATPERTEDLLSYGGELRWRLSDLADATFQAIHTEIDSALSSGDRSYNSVGISVNLAWGL